MYGSLLQKENELRVHFFVIRGLFQDKINELLGPILTLRHPIIFIFIFAWWV